MNEMMQGDPTPKKEEEKKPEEQKPKPEEEVKKDEETVAGFPKDIIDELYKHEDDDDLYGRR